MIWSCNAVRLALKNERFGSFVIFLTFPKKSNPDFALNERSLQPQKKKSQLHFKQVCGQCGFETRVHRKSYETRGKRFGNLESFLRKWTLWQFYHLLDFFQEQIPCFGVEWKIIATTKNLICISNKIAVNVGMKFEYTESLMIQEAFFAHQALYVFYTEMVRSFPPDS